MIDRLERLINLVIALREARRPMTAEEIHERVAGYGQDDHEAFRRMFERDKADLRALGVPIETAAIDVWEDQVGYRIDPRRYDLPPVRLEPGELAALAVALQVTGLADDAGSGLLKLGVDAGAPDVSAPGMPGGPATGFEVTLRAPHLTVLGEAQVSRTPVRFTYRSPGRDSAQRTVDPYALVHRRGNWYLVGRDHDRDDRRAFRLDRISGDVQMAGAPDSFSAPPEIGADDVVPPTGADGPDVARVAVVDELAWQVARRARGGGRPGSAGWTVFDVAVPDPDAFVGWALEHGPDLVVLEPAELREAVIEKLQELVGGQR